MMDNAKYEQTQLTWVLNLLNSLLVNYKPKLLKQRKFTIQPYQTITIALLEKLIKRYISLFYEYRSGDLSLFS